jgi:hypothetical protein
LRARCPPLLKKKMLRKKKEMNSSLLQDFIKDFQNNQDDKGFNQFVHLFLSMFCEAHLYRKITSFFWDHLISLYHTSKNYSKIIGKKTGIFLGPEQIDTVTIKGNNSPSLVKRDYILKQH